jgi:hydrogenase nickel incorporation protein HypA/HybF
VHEQSLMKDLMRKIYAVAEEQDADRIKRIRVRVGALAHMSADHFREHFVHASAGGVADGAQVEVIMGDDPADPRAQDVMLESIEIEVSG